MQLIYLHIPYRLHKITFLEYIELISLEIHLIRWLSDTKKDRSLSIFLENERSFTLLSLSWMMMILLSLWCVSEAAVQYNRHVYPIRNCLFVRFSVTLFKPEKPLKVPEVKKFYKHFGSHAVVEFLINTVFAASCFLGTLLVAFAQIKDSYKSARCSATIVSICDENYFLY